MSHTTVTSPQTNSIRGTTVRPTLAHIIPPPTQSRTDQTASPTNSSANSQSGESLNSQTEERKFQQFPNSAVIRDRGARLITTRRKWKIEDEYYQQWLQVMEQFACIARASVSSNS